MRPGVADISGIVGAARIQHHYRMDITRLAAAAAAAALLAAPGAGRADTPPIAPSHTAVRHVAWARDAFIYEVNIRQYTPQGTFTAFEAHLPRLRRLGVKILWIMPINPIGVENRKGALGSYYAVRDYTAVNPEYGTLDDFRRLVRRAHALGMKVIIDWVANHSAWDNPWVSQHADWYRKDKNGKIFPVTYGEPPHQEVWSDVVQFDYRAPGLADAMIGAMAFWVRETDIDGFRCDVAGEVPTAFWERARRDLDRIKPMFMLAESDKPELQQAAFDMTYDWGLYALMKRAAKGEAAAPDIAAYVTRPPRVYPPGSYRMLFTSDHDENSWNGGDGELYGDGFKAFAVLAATLPGMPLIYGGQEGRLDHRLAFFERDPIDWHGYERSEFYARLTGLKARHRALWNGDSGAPAEVLPTGDDRIFAFQRRKGRDAVTVIANLSPQPRVANLRGRSPAPLAPWGYLILESR